MSETEEHQEANARFFVEAVHIATRFGGLLSVEALSDLEDMVMKAMRKAERLGREAEREECAVLCEHHYSEEHDRLRLGLAENFDITRGRMNIALELSDFIRSRTTPEGEGEGT